VSEFGSGETGFSINGFDGAGKAAEEGFCSRDGRGEIDCIG
jgi:hypothetical protein